MCWGWESKGHMFSVVNAGLCCPGPPHKWKDLWPLFWEVVSTQSLQPSASSDCFSCRASHSKSCPLLRGQQPTSKLTDVLVKSPAGQLAPHVIVAPDFSYSFGDITTWLVFLPQHILSLLIRAMSPRGAPPQIPCTLNSDSKLPSGEPSMGPLAPGPTERKNDGKMGFWRRTTHSSPGCQWRSNCCSSVKYLVLGTTWLSSC